MLPGLALRCVSASHQGELGLFQLPTFDLTGLGLQLSSGMKTVFLRVSQARDGLAASECL